MILKVSSNLNHAVILRFSSPCFRRHSPPRSSSRGSERNYPEKHRGTKGSGAKPSLPSHATLPPQAIRSGRAPHGHTTCSRTRSHADLTTAPLHGPRLRPFGMIRDGAGGMLLSLPRLVLRAEPWSPVLDRLCFTPSKQHPTGCGEQQLLPTPPLGDPAVSGGTAKTSEAYVLQPDTSATLPPSPRVCCTTWRKGHRCHSCSPGGCAGRSCKRPVPRIRRRVRLSPRTRNKPRRLLWGQGIQTGPQQLLLTFRFIKTCYGLTVCRTRVFVDALFSFRLASLWHLLFPSTNYFLRFNNHQHTAISSSPYREKSLQ